MPNKHHIYIHIASMPVSDERYSKAVASTVSYETMREHMNRTLDKHLEDTATIGVLIPKKGFVKDTKPLISNMCKDQQVEIHVLGHCTDGSQYMWSDDTKKMIHHRELAEHILSIVGPRGND